MKNNAASKRRLRNGLQAWNTLASSKAISDASRVCLKDSSTDLEAAEHFGRALEANREALDASDRIPWQDLRGELHAIFAWMLEAVENGRSGDHAAFADYDRRFNVAEEEARRRFANADLDSGFFDCVAQRKCLQQVLRAQFFVAPGAFERFHRVLRGE